MIKVQELGFTYAGASSAAIKGLSFDIEPGEVFGFLGPSGAGKSTTQRILTGLLRPYTGQISVFGRELSEWGSDLFERVGVSFELPNHFLKLTGRENLSYFRALYSGTTKDPDELLASFGLQESANMLVGQYSKGMMTRLGVARALLHDPELIFMDEPTGGLDPATARIVKGMIQGQRKAGKTVFLTTHDMTTVEELCDRVAFIVDGKIRVVDRPRDLKLRFGEPQVKIEYRKDNRLLVEKMPLSGLAENQNFLELIRNEDIETIHSQEASLDEIFVQITGAALT